MSFKVGVRFTRSEIDGVFKEVSGVNFINSGTHGDPFKLFARASEDDVIGSEMGEPLLFINTAEVSAVMIEEEAEE